MVESEFDRESDRSWIRISEKALTAVSSLDGRLLRSIEICSEEDTRKDEHNYQPDRSGVECSMCGDVGFVDLLQFCSVCKSRAQHLYCMAPNPRRKTGTNSNLRDLSWRCNQCVLVQGTAGAARKEDLRIRAPLDSSPGSSRRLTDVSSTFRSGFDTRFVSFPVTCSRNPDQQTNSAEKPTNLWPVKITPAGGNSHFHQYVHHGEINEGGSRAGSLDQNRQQSSDFTRSKSNAKRGLEEVWEAANSSIKNQCSKVQNAEIRTGNFVIRRKLGAPDNRPEVDNGRPNLKIKLSTLSRTPGSDSDPDLGCYTEGGAGNLLSKQANGSHHGRRTYRIMHSPRTEKTSNSKLLIRRYKSLSELSC